jgi:PIN domain nuclease of toxin-antitoxin system
VRVLIDTMVLIWAAQGPARLSQRAARTLRNPRCILELSALSISEIAIKNRSGKLNLPEADLHKALDDLDVRVLPFTREHALKLFGLPWHHPDPFDRQILAQALVEEISVVTSDEVFGRYEGVHVIW